MSATIRDVAKAAGVSSSTVSRIINNKGVISEETRDRVLKVMKKLDYVPNDTARSFANGSTSAIALVIDVIEARSFSNNFFNNSVFGIETIAHENNFNLIITNGHMQKGNTTSADKLVFGKKVDGIILPNSLISHTFIGKLNKIRFPYVVLGDPRMLDADNSWVDINNVQGGTLAVHHLVENGYKNIAFLSSGSKEIFNQDRITGYSRALNELGLPVLKERIRHCNSDVGSGLDVMSRMFQAEHPPDAAICSDYYLAVGALRAARQNGIPVPEAFGIISFDNTPVTELSEPSITTVDIDTFGLGEQAASILIRKIKDKDMSSRQILISTKIIERESTKRNRRRQDGE
ncbi:LacI family DNA-binding transcriptional regulator [Caproicibacter fermentans]|uniref:LacI family DNA-binding transcriptional regulator n=1 Tax=Caproicibacter fermentans TaxID=2576756 RepID=A0A7G8T686_9FIRM|nr:LacI family DNA-binding transcriptional regulator [Caproicibacter fermentans]QNK39127.1 LacI family DNA-binding transcriptional regulator [Caproicibacter fermentans]